MTRALGLAVAVALVWLAALLPGSPSAAPGAPREPPEPREPVHDLPTIARDWTPFGWFGDWALYDAPAPQSPEASPGSDEQDLPLSIAYTGKAVPALGAYVECRSWMCGTSLRFGVLVGHDVLRVRGRADAQGARPRARLLLEPNAGFSHETDALLSVADKGFPLQLSLLLSALLPDGRPFHRLMREFSPTLPQDALNELRRSSGLRAHVPHGDGTLRVHEISLWGFSQAVDAMELRCRHFAESRGALKKDVCRRLLESERRQ